MKIKTDRPFLQDRAKITKKIARFWNQISTGWRSVWGVHIHHGFYENNESLSPLEAQEKLIRKLTEITTISPHDKILDVGCGMGGTSLFLAKNFHANVSGITLSEKQIAIATQQSQLENVNNVNFKIEDALSLESFSDNSFDIVWSLESCEQFYNKILFIKEAYRVLKPGGKIMLATWCSSKDEYEGKYAKKYLKLCHSFDLPYMPSMDYYLKQLEMGGFKLNYVSDWSKQVKKSWDVSISLINAYSFLKILKIGGLRGLQFVYQIRLMRDAFNENSVKYGVFVATKP